jgi:hypothetical protein
MLPTSSNVHDQLGELVGIAGTLRLLHERRSQTASRIISMGAAIQSAKVRAFSGTHPAIHSAQTPVAITNAGMIHHT